MDHDAMALIQGMFEQIGDRLGDGDKRMGRIESKVDRVAEIAAQTVAQHQTLDRLDKRVGLLEQWRDAHLQSHRDNPTTAEQISVLKRLWMTQGKFAVGILVALAAMVLAVVAPPEAWRTITGMLGVAK